MHTIILGAGRIGQHVAHHLTLEGHSVVLVDKNSRVLEEAAQKIDVATAHGMATDWNLLGELIAEGPSLLLALTDADDTNLVACTMAKGLAGATPLRTIARIREWRYAGAGPVQLDVGRLFHADHIVVPELLVAEQIVKVALHRGRYSESFFHGSAYLRTVDIAKGWPYAGKTLAELSLAERMMMVGLINRQQAAKSLIGGGTEEELFFPHGKDTILQGDELTVIGDSRGLQGMQSFFGLADILPDTALVVGGTAVGAHLARVLAQRGVSVRLVEGSAERCKALAEALPHVAIVHAEEEPAILQAEQVANKELFVACTLIEDKNVLLGMCARDAGCKQVTCVLSDESVIRMAERAGIAHVVATPVVAADRIMALAREEKITTITSLYDQRADVVEARVSPDSPLIGIPLSALGPRLPKEMLVALIHSRGRVVVASGSHILLPGDEIVVICRPDHRTFLEEVL